MDIRECFKKDYILLDEKGKNTINYFMESEGKKYREPIKYIFLHNTKNEMFIILDCINMKMDNVENLCDEWEGIILGFVNFSSELRENIDFLKYNITLILLVNEKLIKDNNDVEFKEEKSLTVCRKIFISCDNGSNINDSESTILPFYFDSIEKMNTLEIEKLERKIYELMPNEKNIQSILKKDNIDEDDIKKICGWLVSNEDC